MGFKIILFFLCLLSFDLAYSYQLKIAPKYEMKLAKNNWDYAKGSFFQGGTPINLYSNIQSKDFQILFEDTILLTQTIPNRLPTNCQNQIDNKNLSESSYCFISEQKKGLYSFTTFTMFKTKQPSVMKVRSVVFVGKKNDVKKYEDLVKRGLASTSGPKKFKVRK